MKMRILVLAAFAAACSVEPPYDEDSPTAPTAQSGTLRGSVVFADQPSHGAAGVLVGLRSAVEHHLVTTDAEGVFRAELPLTEWRAELQIPEGFQRAPGETGTRVAVAQPDRVISLLPFRITPAVSDTTPVGPPRP